MKFYVGYNQLANSYSVFEAGRKNQFGEKYCVVPLVSKHEAERCAECLNNGRDAWAWLNR